MHGNKWRYKNVQFFPQQLAQNSEKENSEKIKNLELRLELWNSKILNKMASVL